MRSCGASSVPIDSTSPSSSSGRTATTISSAGKVASASRMASPTFASPAAASTSSPGSRSAVRSATSSAWLNAFWSLASQSSAPCRTTGTTTLIVSASPTWARRTSSACSTVLTTRTFLAIRKRRLLGDLLDHVAGVLRVRFLGDVGLGDDADEAAVLLDDRQPPHLMAGHEAKGLVELLLRVDGDE